MRRERRKPTIYEVAKRAGVSITTVSHALSGARPVNLQTAELVWKVADELGYRPSRLAAQLTSGSTGNLGLVLPDMSNESFTTVARAVHDAAFSAGYHVLIRNSDESFDEEADAVRSFLSDGIVDGVILIATDGTHDYLHELLDQGHRIIATNRPVAGVELPTIARDDVGSAYHAARHLITLGHRHIAVLAGRRELLSTQQRLEGIKQALAEAGHPEPLVRYSIVRPGEDPIEDVRRSTHEVLDQSQPVSAVIGLSQRILEGATRAFREYDIRCPDDMALLSYGRARLAAVMDSTPTVIDQDARRFGEKATESLVTWLRTDNAPESVIIPPVYVLGETCGWRRFAPDKADSVFIASPTPRPV